MLKHFVVSLLTIAFSFSYLLAEEIVLTIVGSDRPLVGSALVADINIENCTFKWTRGNTKDVYESATISESSEYVPTETDYEHWLKVTAYAEGSAVASSKIWFSKLPVIYITTDDGAAITTKETYKGAKLRIQGNAEFKEQYNGAIEVKGRGNSSWTSYPQKPYKIKLASKTNLFGFGKNKHWVLISNYGDNAMMRNKFASDLAKELNIVGMDMTWTPCILNGKYNGVYMFSEHIRIDKNRVDVYDWESYAEDKADALYSLVCENDGLTEDDMAALETLMSEKLSWITTGKVTYKSKVYDLEELGIKEELDLSGGYLFQLDGRYDETSKFKTSTGLMISIDKPEFAATDTTMMNAVKSIWTEFETSYRSMNGYYNGKHFSELCDLDSMVSFWLVNEFMSNMDAPVFSRYAFKNRGEKLKFGPVWDFDYGANSIQVQASNYVGRREATSWACAKFHHSNATYNQQTFFADWLDDPIVCLRACQIYNEKVRPWAESLLKDGGVIDSKLEYLTEAGSAHDTLYKRYGFNGASGDVARLRTFLTSRMAWLDEQFADVDTLMKSVATEYSQHPYAKNVEAIVLSQDAESLVKVEVKDAAITNVRLYANGLSLEMGGGVQESVDLSNVDTSVGNKVLIACDGYDASGAIVARNFLVVDAIEDDVPPEEQDKVIDAVVLATDGKVCEMDTSKFKNLVFDGGAAGEATLTIAEETGTGKEIICIAEGKKIVLNTDAALVVGGELALSGTIEGNGHNLKKSGEGRLTLSLQNATGVPTIDKLQCDGGIVALEKPISVNSITKSGPLWVVADATSPDSAALSSTYCAEKLSAKKVCLFVPTSEGDCVYFGGVVAKSALTAASGCEVYTLDSEGSISFAGTLWSKSSSAEVSVVSTSSGEKTYEIAIKPDPPKGIDGKPIVDPKAYGKYFKKSENNGGSQNSQGVSIFVLDEEEVDLNSSLEDLESCLSDPAASSVAVSSKPGLYYSVMASGNLDSELEEGTRKLATGETVELEVPKFKNSGFYKIKVSVSREEP